MKNKPNKKKLDKNVILMGMTSFFTDVSSEMIYPLLHAFVTMILASQKALLGPILGIIEGIAESTASLLKIFIGYYSDKIQKRKILAISGYSLSSGAKILLFLSALSWYFVLLSRFLDRIGKGIRTAPRDALISESTPKEMQGKAYGFHRAMDFAGAFIGVIICYSLTLRFMDPITKNLKNLNSFYILFAISIIPSFIGIFFLFFVKEQKKVTITCKPKPNLDIRKYDNNLKLFFIAQFIFTLGNSSNQFLLLHSMNLGYSLSTVILMYMIFNFSASILSTFFGSLSDKIGRKKILIIGYLIYSFVYISFGFITKNTNILLWVFWIIYGIYYSMTEGVEKAFVSCSVSSDSKATALGFYHTIVGITLLPASIIAGILFSVHESVPFVFGGSMSLFASIILLLRLKEKPQCSL
ncbi:MAG: MFS transporter [Desulfobacterales bacterium]|nr:MFS transporter [Desulfobacterales bacterium]